MNKFKKTIAGVLGFTIALSLVVVATTAKADTISDLQAQIATLTAQLSKLAGTPAASSATAAISSDKSSVGGMLKADVVALQKFLIANGESIPAGATGTYGPQTTKAVAAYQVKNAITPAAGYFGPKTRAIVNGSSVAAPVVSGTVAPVGVTTVGAEGTITVSQDSSNVKSTVYENDSMVPVLGFKVEAKSSDMSVQRVKVLIGTTTNSYTKIFKKIYLTDASGAVLASSDLNSSTVNRDDSTHYTVTLAGFKSVVKKDAIASFFVKFDIASSISSEYRITQQVSITADAVRAQDGAGLDQYTSSTWTGITVNPTVSKSLSDSATLTLSTDPSVLTAQTIVANGGSANNEADQVTVASFRALAEKSSVLVRDLTVTASSTVTGATEPTAYLYDGSTEIASAAGVVTGTSTVYSFTSINQTLSKDSTKTYTVKVDVRSAGTVAENFSIVGVSVPSAETVSSGNAVTVSNLNTVGNVMTFIASGVTSTLASSNATAVITKTAGVDTQGVLTADYNVTLGATGADANFGTASSSFVFKLFRDNVDISSFATSTVTYQVTTPSGATNYSATGFTVPRNSAVTLDVTYKVVTTGTTTTAFVLPSTGTYVVRLDSVNYTPTGGSLVSNNNSANTVWVKNVTTSTQVSN
ncbi:MAG: peptidoglycan-binding protein [bacterium]